MKLLASMDGMVVDTLRSPSGVSSMDVMQLELATFWAASLPVARKMAVTTLAACALNPPMLPAMAEPSRFLTLLQSWYG